MDYDPDGLAIFSVYKDGSAAMAAEKVNLTTPCMQHLGLLRRHVSDEDGTHQAQGLMPLTFRDRKKAKDMLGRMVPSEEEAEGIGEVDEEGRMELQVMLVLNLKAELQILDAVPSGLDELLYEYLPLQR